MKKLLSLFLSVCLPLSLLLAGCGNEQSKKKDKDILTVYTTVYPLQYFTERIGGSYVDVQTVYPPGSDEHTFEPTQKDMIDLINADYFFYIGLGLEGFVNKAKDTLKNEEVTLVALGEQIDIEKTHSENGASHDEEEDSDHGHSNGSVDPHVWLDPLYADELANTIKQELVKKMPSKKDVFEKNYQTLAKELKELDQAFESTIQTAKHKEFIVSHAAYGYWEDRYGIEQISISGLSTTNEPSQKKLEEIVTQAKEHNIHYILFEQNVTSKLADIIKQEVGAQPLMIHNLSVLTPENIKQKATYFTIMNQNLKTLKTALNE
jgi:zinc transport system substrate-binding protein